MNMLPRLIRKRSMEEAGLLEPEFDIDGFFIVTLKRESYLRKYSSGVGDSVGEKYIALSEIQYKLIKVIEENAKISATKISEQLNVTSRTIELNIEKLKAMGIIQRISPDKGGHWIIAKEINHKK